MSLNDFLPDLAAKYEALQTLFEDIGTPDSIRTQESQALFDQCIAAMDSQVAKLAESRDQLVVQCDQLMDSIRSMTGLLGQGDDAIQALFETLQSMSLWDRHCLLKDEHRFIQEHYNQKLAEIRELHQRLSSFIDILGPSLVQPGPIPGDNVSVTFDVAQKFEDAIAACEKLHKQRKESVEASIAGIKKMWVQLGITPQDSFDRDVIDGGQEEISVTDDTLRRLEMRESMLESERLRRKVFLKDHLTEISTLWDKLRIDDKYREEFLEAHVGLTNDDVRAHKDELSRLEEMKSQKLEEFIKAERATLHELWDKLYYTEEQWQSFTPLQDDTYTDANLAAHEAESTRLKAEVAQHEHVLNAVERYQLLLEDIRAFEITSMDSQRLFHRDPGRLLREEKFRKRMGRELPKAASELEEILIRWQEENGRPFMVHGEEYISAMMMHAQEARAGRENEKRGRAQRKYLALLQDLRYGSQNPNKIPQSPHPRRISPSVPPESTVDRGSPPPSSLEPRTPTSNRTGMPFNRPGTPTSQHTRTLPSFLPTTPTRARSQTLQTTPSRSSHSNQNPFLQSPRKLHSTSFQRQGGVGSKMYSRSESPAGTGFSLTRLPSTQSFRHANGRISGPTGTTTSLELLNSPFGSPTRRNGSIISISSMATDTVEEISSPSQRSKAGRTVNYDLTECLEEVEEIPAFPRPDSTPRRLKRPAADLFSPSGTPPRSPLHSKRRSGSTSPRRTAHSMSESPFMDTTGSGDGDDLVISASKRPNNKFLKQLLKAQQETVIDLDADMQCSQGAGKDTSMDDSQYDPRKSLILMDRSEAEVIFSKAGSRAEKTVTQLMVREDDVGSDGWETENEDSPRSKKKNKGHVVAN